MGIKNNLRFVFFIAFLSESKNGVGLIHLGQHQNGKGMKVIIQKRRVVNVEDICAVVDDVDSTFVLVDGHMIRVAERYRKHVKDSVYYWKSLFRKSNELLRSEITSAWTSLKEPLMESTSENNDAQVIDEEDEQTETNPLEVEMRTVQIQTNDSDDTVDDSQSSKEEDEESTEEASESDCNREETDQTDNDSSEQ